MLSESEEDSSETVYESCEETIITDTEDDETSSESNENNSQHDESTENELDERGDEPTHDEDSKGVYLHEKTFANRGEFSKFFEKETWWSEQRNYLTLDGKKTFYRCNKVKRRGKQCDAGIYAISESNPNDDQIFLFRKTLGHTHEESINRSHRLSDKAKERILELTKTKHAPRQIFFKMSNDPDFVDISLTKIKSFLQMHKRQQPSQLTLSALIVFIQTKMAIPESDDEAFVVLFEHSDENEEYTEDKEPWFRFLVSSKRLLKTALVGKNIHADSTHKIVIENYPLLVVGYTDMCRHFHMVGLMLSSRETSEDYEFMFNAIIHGCSTIYDQRIRPKVLIADGAHAINNGFKKAFMDDETVTVMCWFHVLYNFKKAKLNEQENRKHIKEDLRILCLSYNNSIFDIGSELFVRKWNESEKEFIQNFSEIYLKQHRFWYHGATLNAPNHNNALERYNGLFKQYQLSYQKAGLANFKDKLLEAVSEYSAEYKNVRKPFQNDVETTTKTMELGYALSKNEKTFIPITSADRKIVKFYCFAGESKANINREHVEQHLKFQYETFDDFAKGAFNIHEISMAGDCVSWKQSTCTCPFYLKMYMCKHVVAVAYILQIIEKPATKMGDAVLSKKRKAGRQKKISKALVKE